MDGIRHAKSTVAVSTRPTKGHLIAIATNGSMRDSVAGTVNRDEIVDTAGKGLREQPLHAAKVARALLADCPDEEKRSQWFDIRILHGPRHSQNHSQSAAIITNTWTKKLRTLAPHGDIRCGWKHRIEVSRQNHSWLTLSDLSKNVTFLVDANVG